MEKPDTGAFQVAEMIGGVWKIRDMTAEEVEVAFPPPPAPDPALMPPITLTKLQIRDQAFATDPSLWAAIKAFIEADQERAERWALAIAIPTDDPILDSLQSQLQWTDEQRAEFISAAAAR